MLQFIYDNLEHVLCIAILVGRLGDIGSTYLVTPKLKLETRRPARAVAGRPWYASGLRPWVRRPLTNVLPRG